MSSSRKRARSQSPPSLGDIYRSEPIADRSSTFIGLFSPTLPVSSIAALSELKEAHHRMSASRKASRQRTLRLSLTSKVQGQIYVTDCDDDGEKYGGKRCEKVLEAMNVEGSVVVARWYGGVLLGPVRFAHIETCARNSIKAWLAAQQKNESLPPAKKILTEAEVESQKVNLVKYLQERDTSIEVLRDLLATKSVGTTRETGPHSTRPDASGAAGPSGGHDAPIATQASPSQSVTLKQGMDYEALSLEALRRLERARDATIGFILKQIDKAEQADE